MIAITGITGHTGSFFLKELISNKYPDSIRCLVRENSNTGELDGCGLDIEKIIGTLEDPQTINALIDGAGAVVHIANIRYSLAIVEAAHAYGIRRVILIHTTGIFSKYKTASEEYKLIEEKLSPYFDSGMDITILRPTMIFGDLCDRNIRKFIRLVDLLPVMPEINHGSGLIQPVNARDLGKAYYQVLCQERLPEKAYIVSGERPVSMHELYLEIGRKLGKNVRFLNVPLPLGVGLARLAKLVSIGRADYVERMLRMGEDRSFSHTEASRDFGYRPEPFSTGLEREIDAYLKKKQTVR